MSNSQEIEAAIQALDNLQTELQDVTFTTLNELAAEIQSELISNAASALERRSASSGIDDIQVNFSGNQLGIQMRDYMWYQTFGVLGKQGVSNRRTSAEKLPFGISGSSITIPEGTTFEFTNINHPGLFGIQRSITLLQRLAAGAVAAALQEAYDKNN
jgi:hypothetical protein